MSDTLWLLGAVVLALIVGGVLQSRFKRWRSSLRWRRRRTRAARGEERAVRVLARAGYKVVDEQHETTWPILVNGERVEVKVRADYIVKRRFKHYVAEVKTGKSAPKPTNRDTRRQLLEYRLAYDVSGVLLVDMEAERIDRIEFPKLR